MAFADWAAIQAASRRINPAYGEYVKEPATTGDSREVRWLSSIRTDGTNGTKSIPSTSTALSYSTDPEWSIAHPTAAAGTVHVVGCAHGWDNSSYTGLLVDRLVQQGGLVGNITTSQTTNLPTTALPTRATGGDGVWMALQIYSTAGSTDTIVTTTYTNQAGTGSRTSTHYYYDTPIGNALHILQLQDGDTGVRSVESVQLSASTGSAGNWGILLFKPLAFIQPRSKSAISGVDTIIGWGDGIEDEAVLELWQDGTENVAQYAFYSLTFAEA